MLLGFSVFASKSSTNLVRDVSCRQDGNNIVISYNLKKKADVDIFCSTDGGKTFKRIFRVSGDVGYGISSGNKEIVWNVLDERDNLIGDICFKVEATEIDKPTKSHNTSSYSSFSYLNLLYGFYDVNGSLDFEIVNASAEIGGYWGLEIGMLSLRYKMFELDWANLSIFSKDYSFKEYSFAYDPVVRLHIPVNYEWSIYAGAALSMAFGTSTASNDFKPVDDMVPSFKTEIGARWYSPGVILFDLFLRYKYQFGVTVGLAMRVPGLETLMNKH